MQADPAPRGRIAVGGRIGYAVAMRANANASQAGIPPGITRGISPGIPPGLLLDARGGAGARRRAVGRDVVDGTVQWKLAFVLGWLDIKLRYRGSVLGPFWLTLSTAVMVGSMGLIYGTLFGMVLRDYLPFLALSMILWTSGISGLTGDACTVFLDAEQIIRSVRMPFTVQVLRCIVRNVIVLAHNLVVVVVVFTIFDTWPGFGALLSLPGLALWLVDAVAACFLLGSICARFRDVPPIVTSIMQIAFYVTPIIWKPAQLGVHAWWLPANPFYCLLEIVRGPILGTSLHAHQAAALWVSALAYSALLWLAAWVVFSRARGRLAFWV